MIYQIRLAAEADLPTLLEFEQAIIEAERPYDPTLKPERISYYDLRELIRSPQADVLVATFHDEIVGSAYVQIKKSKPFLVHEQFAYLGFMYVKPEHRGRGVNGMIIDALKAWIRSRNLTEVRLNVYHGNESAIRAYEKAGFQKYMVNMRMGIE